MKLINEITIENKKSKFIGYFYELEDLKEVDQILNSIKKEHKKARHIPYAYIYNGKIKRTDDGEPKHTAGIQIYNALQNNHLNNHLIIIVRYFGGTLLGASNLLRTFSKLANNLIK